MAKAKSVNTAKLVNGLNEMAEGEFNYKKAIVAEDQKFGKGLRARQKKVVADLEEEFGVGLTNSKKGGTKEMAVKGGVKTKVATKKVVPPKKVDLNAVKLKAMDYLEEVEKVADFGNIKYELEKVNIGILQFKQNSRLIFGVMYAVYGDKVSYSLVAREPFKNFSKSLQGKYQPGNWNVLFNLDNSDDIKKFTPIIEASVEKFKKVEQPKAKTNKKKK